MDRRARHLWMRDILEHLSDCFEQWQAGDPRSRRFLTDAMCRDLDEFRRLLAEEGRGEDAAGYRMDAAA